MGRPLKIQKYGLAQGITYGNNGAVNQPAAAVAVDQGYPPFADPTSMDTATVVLPQPVTTPLPFTGVVGGNRGGAVSATYPVVKVTVNIALPNGTGQGSTTGVILRQKGAHKFLVMSSGTTVADESIVLGASYYINSVGSTDWSLFGAPAGYGVGTIFTATAAGSNSGNGNCFLVGQCVLKDQATPSAGNMNIVITVGDSTGVRVSKITNKFVQDFFGGATGGNADTGDVWNPSQVVNDIEYAANFFVDGETFAKSGADDATWAGTNQNSDGTLTMAQVNDWTS